MHLFYLFSVWLHILAAAVWIGGMVFLSLVLIPALRRIEHRPTASWLMHVAGVRFRWVGWVCLFLLLVTGTINLAYRGVGLGDLWSGGVWQSDFGAILGAKLLFVVGVIGLSFFHDFFIGPKASAVGRADPGSPDAMRLRRQASWLGRANLFLSLLLTALGVMLVRGPLW